MRDTEGAAQQIPHVRFDERGRETEPWYGMRHRHLAKAAGNGYSPMPTAPTGGLGSYSSRSARIGSIDAARLAGIRLASIVTAISDSVTSE